MRVFFLVPLPAFLGALADIFEGVLAMDEKWARRRGWSVLCLGGGEGTRRVNVSKAGAVVVVPRLHVSAVRCDAGREVQAVQACAREAGRETSWPTRHK